MSDNAASAKEETGQLGTDSRLATALETYLIELEEGCVPDLNAFLARYPRIATELAESIRGLEYIHQIGPELHRTNSKHAAHSSMSAAALGDFRLWREIGRGGMGVVYEAEQISLARRVAVKVLPFAALLDDRQLERFKNEARAAAMLKHPNIVSVYSIGCERGIHYYAMELISGCNLGQLIEQLRRSPKVRLACPKTGDATTQSLDNEVETSTIAKLSTQYDSDRTTFFRSVARMGIQAADALEYADCNGVIHRDIKPSNLMLDERGKLSVTDFGLASTHADSSLTMSGDLLGTLRYMSPEQARGKTAVIDARTDTYSLGVTLYELLTLQPSFRGDDRQVVLNQILNVDPTAPREIDNRIPHDLETIVLKAISKQPEDRYESAQRIGDDLSRFLENRPIQARRATRAEKACRWARRNVLLAAMLTTVASLLLLLSAGSLAVAWRTVVAAKRHELALYARDMQLVQNDLTDGDYLGAEARLLRWITSNDNIDHRNFEWFYLWNKCRLRAARRTLKHSLPVVGVAYSQDGTELFTSLSFSGRIGAWDARTGSTRRTFEGSSVDVQVLKMHRDTGLLIAGDRAGNVTLWNVNSGTMQELIELPVSPEDAAIRSVALSPDGNLVAVGAGRTSSFSEKPPARVHVWNRSSLSWHSLVGFVGKPKLEFSADGRSLITGCHHGTIKIWNTERWAVERELPVDVGAISAITTSVDGSLLAVASADQQGPPHRSQIDVWQVDDWQTKTSYRPHDSLVHDISFSPDNRWLAAASADHNVSLNAVSSGHSILLKAAHMNRVTCLAFTPDGKFLCSGSTDNTARVWQIEDITRQPSSDVTYRGHDAHICGSAFIDDDSRVASVDVSGRVHIWDAISGETEETIEVELDTANTACISAAPNGRMLAVQRGHWPNSNVYRAHLEIIELPSLHVLHRIELPHGSICYRMEFSPDSQMLAVPCLHHLVVIDVRKGQIIKALGPYERSDSVRAFATIKGTAFSPDNSRLLLGAVGDRSGRIRIFDTNKFSELESFETGDWAVEGLTYSPEGATVAFCGANATVTIRDTKDWRLIEPSFPKCPDILVHVRFTPDGKRVIALDKNGVLRIWHRDTREELLKLQNVETWTGNFDVSSNGRALAVGAGNSAVVFRAADPKYYERIEVRELPHFGCEN